MGGTNREAAKANEPCNGKRKHHRRREEIRKDRRKHWEALISYRSPEAARAHRSRYGDYDSEN